MRKEKHDGIRNCFNCEYARILDNDDILCNNKTIIEREKASIPCHAAKALSYYEDEKSDGTASFNTQVREDLKKLPNIYEALKLYQNGDKDIFEKYFYEYRYTEKNSIKAYIKFWDCEINDLLKKLKATFCNKSDRTLEFITKPCGFIANKIGFVPSDTVFDEYEIDTLFHNFLVNVIAKEPISKFPNVYKLRRYIIKGFVGEIIDEYNKRSGIERRQKDGKKYKLFKNPKIGFFNDIILPANADKYDDNDISANDLLVKTTQKQYYYWNDEDKYIMTQYKNVLTKEQLRKFNRLVNYIELCQHKNVKPEIEEQFTHLYNEKKKQYEDLFNSNWYKTGRLTSDIFVKAVVGKVILKNHDRNIRNLTKDVDDFLASCRGRMNNKLKEQGYEGLKFQTDIVDPVSIAPVSEYVIDRQQIIYRLIARYIFTNDLYSILNQEYIPDSIYDFNIPFEDKIKLLADIWIRQNIPCFSSVI